MAGFSAEHNGAKISMQTMVKVLQEVARDIVFNLFIGS